MSDEFNKKAEVEKMRNQADREKLNDGFKELYDAREKEFNDKIIEKEKLNEATKDERVKTETYRILLEEQRGPALRPPWGTAGSTNVEEIEKAAERRKAMAERRVDLRDKQETMAATDSHLKSQRELINGYLEEQRSPERQTEKSGLEKESDRVARQMQEWQRMRGRDDFERDR